MSKFIMLTGISRSEPLFIRKEDIVSARSVYSEERNYYYTEIYTPSATWKVEESVEDIFNKLEGK